MKKSCCCVFVILVLAPAFLSARHVARPHSHHGHHHHTKSPKSSDETHENQMVKPKMYHGMRRPFLKRQRSHDPLEIAGSSLPDCAHACGSCSPCRLVMVSYVCASMEEAETCPMAYRCMCNHKSFPVP